MSFCLLLCGLRRWGRCVLFSSSPSPYRYSNTMPRLARRLSSSMRLGKKSMKRAETPAKSFRGAWGCDFSSTKVALRAYVFKTTKTICAARSDNANNLGVAFGAQFRQLGFAWRTIRRPPGEKRRPRGESKGVGRPYPTTTSPQSSTVPVSDDMLRPILWTVLPEARYSVA